MTKLLIFIIPFLFYGGNWEEMTSYEGKFKISTPGQMTKKTQMIETEIGFIEYHTYLYQDESEAADNLVYLISFCDYPKNTVHSDSTALIAEFFETTIESARQSVDGELMYSSENKLKKYPGRLWRIDYNDGTASIKTQAYLVGRRFFNLQTVTRRELSMNESTNLFFDSFQLIE